MLIDIQNKSDLLSDPAYSTNDSAGFDITARNNTLVGPGETVALKTGLFLKQPERFSFRWFVRKVLKLVGVVPMLEIRSRSGLSLKGIVVNNAPGTVDADYPEEIGVILHNQTSRDFEVYAGDRIAQGIVTLAFRAGGHVKTKAVVRKSGFGSTGR